MPTALDLLLSGDCDDILTVDLESRRIIIPSTVENLGVESDDSVRILHFQVPRYYCSIDLSGFTIRVNYKNTSGAGGYYDVANYSIRPSLITFDWVVARPVVAKRGNVVFNVCFRDIANGEVDREFNTAVATLPVLEGLETGSDIVEEYADVFEQLKYEAVGNGATAKIGEATLQASEWVSNGNLHSQVVSIPGVTVNSQVDLTPNVEQLVIFYEKDLTFVTENDKGVVTVYAIGQKPTNDYTIQVTITEVYT